MDRSPLFLAALASAAVPGLDPASVEAVPGVPDQQYDVAFVQDTQHRRWVVRVPRNQAAAAQMESTFGLLALLARRLPFGVPTPKGFAALKEGGRAAIYPYLPGRPIDFSQLPPGPGLTAELGRAIAALHNVDHQLFDEAGLPAYDADTYRTRRLSELDRAAATGHVPTSLLSRWERQLEDVALWRFAPTPTHGDLTGDQVLVVFDDEDDASTGRVKAFTGWEDAKVADPADDFAALVSAASPASVDSLLEAYAHARVERPDPHLLERARLSGEMRVLSDLMGAVGAGDRLVVERCAAALRRLENRLHAEEESANDYRRTGLRPAHTTRPVLVPPELSDEDDDLEDDVDTMFGDRAGTRAGSTGAEQDGDAADREVDDITAAAPEGDDDAAARERDEDVETTAPGRAEPEAAARELDEDVETMFGDRSTAGGAGDAAAVEREQDEDVETMFGDRGAPGDDPDDADTAGADPDTEDQQSRDDAMVGQRPEGAGGPSDEFGIEDEPEPEPAGAEVPPPSSGGAEETAEIDVSPLRRPQPIEGDDPGPDFEPGYDPRA
ncbi:phosphotransferase [Phycicoccus sp. M110.8]|uniref:phosphotransferase n=1 Tax=Phycicoccus sp. M110.8 TaxID=3075433 RepID=UPI0028FD5177|nr:phosphotransferase [Phycicoccus sp. M110.8]MDU0314800.1 phosphotransferase [Phycicoccus sp. M110.8]